MIDKNLDKMHDFLKPHAKSLYYDRKVEFVNMVHEKQKKDAAKLKSMILSIHCVELDLKMFQAINNNLKIR